MMPCPQLTDREGYELFRRAIVEGSSDAWSEIYVYYRPIILGWSRQSCAKSLAGAIPEDVADRALSRAWLALTPEQFARFNCLPSLMGYLRSCVTTAVIDDSRALATRERMYQRLEVPDVTTPEQEVLQNTIRLAFWRQVFRIVRSAHERLVLKEAFVLALPPRKIHARHPEMFADVAIVYAIKRNLINRLMRNRELRQLYEDLFL